jgi:membrane protease YdiL (CAAX protease family)
VAQEVFTNSGESSPGRRKQAIEVSVFLFLIVPSLVISFFATGERALSFPFVAASTILRDLALVSLISYFVWSNREPVHHLGLFTGRVWSEAFLGIVLYIPFFILISIIENILVDAGLSTRPETATSFLTPKGYPEFLLAVVLVIVVAISEELIFRGYLILRFTNTIGNVFYAVLLSSFIFSLGHGYEGSAGLVTVGIMGFIFALIYLWRMSLVAPIVMHFLQDFIGIVLVPFLHK